MALDVKIRQYRPGDARALYEAARESTLEVFRWLPWCHPGHSLREAEELIGSRNRLFDEGTEYCFAVVDPAGRFLGGCALNHIHTMHRLANVGYWVRRSEHNQGVATASIGRLSEFAFSRTDLLRLEFVCALENRASQQVAEKSGAMREAVLRDRLILHAKPIDAVMYAILRSSWDAQSSATAPEGMHRSHT